MEIFNQTVPAWTLITAAIIYLAAWQFQRRINKVMLIGIMYRVTDHVIQAFTNYRGPKI
jgi:cytochrome oxidase assembly protein ShyY1